MEKAYMYVLVETFQQEVFCLSWQMFRYGWM